MKATQQLKDEHQGVKAALRILGVMAGRLEKGEAVDVGDLESLLEFLQVFVDRCHHGKEEDLLFPAMEKAGVPKEGGPIGVMLSEHDTGRGYIRGMKEGLAAYKAGDKQAGKRIAQNIEGYSALLNDHIDKEDNILYVIADRTLHEREQEELVGGFDKIEEERIGPGKHEEFHRMLERQAGKYLGVKAG